MKGFLLSFQSEYYKSRKTMGFWSSVILPLLLCVLLFIAFFTKSEQLAPLPGQMLWVSFSGAILGVMGSLLLPVLLVFIAYSVNNIEHKADTWKSLFSLPIAKLAIYGAKYLYAFALVFLCLALFLLLTIGFGNLLGSLKPELRFYEYHIEGTLSLIYFKLFLASLGILSIQFLLSLLFRDFLKPMGIGFFCTITGVILASAKWEYAYLFPYSAPALALNVIARTKGKPGPTQILDIDLLTPEIWVSLAVAVVVFIAGYFIVLKKSVK